MAMKYAQPLSEIELADAAEKFEVFPYVLDSLHNVSLSTLYGRGAKRCSTCHANASDPAHPHDCKPCISLACCPSGHKSGHQACVSKHKDLKHNRKMDMARFKKLKSNAKEQQQKIKTLEKQKKEK